MLGHAGSPSQAPWHGRYLVAGSSDGQVRLWSCGELLAEAAGSLQGCASPEASAANGESDGAAPCRRLITWRLGLYACTLAPVSHATPQARRSQEAPARRQAVVDAGGRAAGEGAGALAEGLCAPANGLQRRIAARGLLPGSQVPGISAGVHRCGTSAAGLSAAAARPAPNPRHACGQAPR